MGGAGFITPRCWFGVCYCRWPLPSYPLALIPLAHPTHTLPVQQPGAEDDEFITRTVTPISAYMGAGTTQVIRVRKGTMRSRGYKTGINADDPVNERSFFTY